MMNSKRLLSMLRDKMYNKKAQFNSKIKLKLNFHNVPLAILILTEKFKKKLLDYTQSFCCYDLICIDCQANYQCFCL